MMKYKDTVCEIKQPYSNEMYMNVNKWLDKNKYTFHKLVEMNPISLSEILFDNAHEMNLTDKEWETKDFKLDLIFLIMAKRLVAQAIVDNRKFYLKGI